VVTVLNNRLTGSAKAKDNGTGGIVVSVEGHPDAKKLSSMRRLATSHGEFEFRVLADPRATESTVIEQAKALKPEKKELVVDGEIVAEWVQYEPADFEPVDKKSEVFVKRAAGDRAEILVLRDSLNVTGKYITAVSKMKDQHGQPALRFTLDEAGGARMSALTSKNAPSSSGGSNLRRLGFIFDKLLLAAPALLSTISEKGVLSGNSLDDSEIDTLVTVAHQGMLPCKVRQVGERVVE
jgi:preprotein translocase subunit SecD